MSPLLCGCGTANASKELSISSNCVLCCAVLCWAHVLWQVGEAPEEVRAVMRQRSRWCKGHMQVREGAAAPSNIMASYPYLPYCSHYRQRFLSCVLPARICTSVACNAIAAPSAIVIVGQHNDIAWKGIVLMDLCMWWSLWNGYLCWFHLPHAGFLQPPVPTVSEAAELAAQAAVHKW